MKQENRIFEKFLNVLVLLGSLFIIIIVSIELLSVRPVLSEQFILNTHLIVCFIFLLDFLSVGFTAVKAGALCGVICFSLSHGAWVALRLIPLARGIYGVSLIVNWMTSSKITNLFITYLTILFIIIYFSSIIFFFVEHGPNPLVKGYWDAFNWALMNVTTVGSNIFGVTKLGQSLAVVLAASGMIFFPIFTAYVTTRFQNKRKRIENN